MGGGVRLFLAFQSAVATGDSPAAVRAGAAVLVFAGAYQLTPLKRACLRQCRSPLAVVVRHGESIMASPFGRVARRRPPWGLLPGMPLGADGRAARRGDDEPGLEGVIAVVVLAEKVWRHGELVSRPLGAGMIALGLVLLAVPGLAPTLTWQRPKTRQRPKT